VTRRVKPTLYWEEDGPLILNGLTVFDGADYTVHTGLLDQHGRPITYQVETMGKIGFVHFPDTPDEEEDTEA
jgi:hypothetical protein